MINKIINSINPNDKDLSTLSKDEFLEALIKLNKYLRCLDESLRMLYANIW